MPMPLTQGGWYKKIHVSTRSILGKRLHVKLAEIVPKQEGKTISISTRTVYFVKIEEVIRRK